jgi:hypothetical protein
MKDDIGTPVARAANTPRRMAALAAVLSLFGTTQALACAVASFGVTTDEFLAAPLILVGDVYSIETIRGTNSSLMTLKVTERLRGDVSGEVTLLWPGYTGGRTSIDDPHIVVGAYLPRTGSMQTRDILNEDVRPDLPAIVTRACGPTSIVTATDPSFGHIRSVMFLRDDFRRATLIGVVFIGLFGHLFGPSIKRLIRRVQP